MTRVLSVFFGILLIVAGFVYTAVLLWGILVYGGAVSWSLTVRSLINSVLTILFDLSFFSAGIGLVLKKDKLIRFGFYYLIVYLLIVIGFAFKRGL